MMIKTLLTWSMVALLGMGSLPAMASGIRTPGLNHWQANQRHRIQQGVCRGSLTSREAARLNAGQRSLNWREARYKSDGFLSRGERTRLRNDSRRLSQNIYRQNHDNQFRNW